MAEGRWRFLGGTDRTPICGNSFLSAAMDFMGNRLSGLSRVLLRSLRCNG